MNLRGIISRATRTAERLMVDQCVIRRQTGMATDPATGIVTPVYETIYPSADDIASGNQGKCKVQTFTNRELVKSGGEYQFIIQRYEVQIPVSAVGVRTNDEALMVNAVYDPDLTGRSYRVAGLMNKSLGSARRLGVEEMPS